MDGGSRLLPFNPQSGQKTMTTQTRSYGSLGDVLLLDGGGSVQLLAVVQFSLQEVALLFFREEGFQSPVDFQTAWCRLHPRAGWRPTQQVYVHRFKRLGTESGKSQESRR